MSILKTTVLAGIVAATLTGCNTGEEQAKEVAQHVDKGVDEIVEAVKAALNTNETKPVTDNKEVAQVAQVTQAEKYGRKHPKQHNAVPVIPINVEPTHVSGHVSTAPKNQMVVTIPPKTPSMVPEKLDNNQTPNLPAMPYAPTTYKAKPGVVTGTLPQNVTVDYAQSPDLIPQANLPETKQTMPTKLDITDTPVPIAPPTKVDVNLSGTEHVVDGFSAGPELVPGNDGKTNVVSGEYSTDTITGEAIVPTSTIDVKPMLIPKERPHKDPIAIPSKTAHVMQKPMIDPSIEPGDKTPPIEPYAVPTKQPIGYTPDYVKPELKSVESSKAIVYNTDTPIQVNSATVNALSGIGMAPKAIPNNDGKSNIVTGKHGDQIAGESIAPDVIKTNKDKKKDNPYYTPDKNPVPSKKVDKHSTDHAYATPEVISAKLKGKKVTDPYYTPEVLKPTKKVNKHTTDHSYATPKEGLYAKLKGKKSDNAYIVPPKAPLLATPGNVAPDLVPEKTAQVPQAGKYNVPSIPRTVEVVRYGDPKAVKQKHVINSEQEVAQGANRKHSADYKEKGSATGYYGKQITAETRPGVDKLLPVGSVTPNPQIVGAERDPMTVMLEQKNRANELAHSLVKADNGIDNFVSKSAKDDYHHKALIDNTKGQKLADSKTAKKDANTIADSKHEKIVNIVAAESNTAENLANTDILKQLALYRPIDDYSFINVESKKAYEQYPEDKYIVESDLKSNNLTFAVISTPSASSEGHMLKLSIGDSFEITVTDSIGKKDGIYDHVKRTLDPFVKDAIYRFMHGDELEFNKSFIVGDYTKGVNGSNYPSYNSANGWIYPANSLFVSLNMVRRDDGNISVKIISSSGTKFFNLYDEAKDYYASIRRAGIIKAHAFEYRAIDRISRVNPEVYAEFDYNPRTGDASKIVFKEPNTVIDKTTANAESKFLRSDKVMDPIGYFNVKLVPNKETFTLFDTRGAINRIEIKTTYKTGSGFSYFNLLIDDKEQRGAVGKMGWGVETSAHATYDDDTSSQWSDFINGESREFETTSFSTQVSPHVSQYSKLMAPSSSSADGEYKTALNMIKFERLDNSKIKINQVITSLRELNEDDYSDLYNEARAHASKLPVTGDMKTGVDLSKRVNIDNFKTSDQSFIAEYVINITTGELISASIYDYHIKNDEHEIIYNQK